MKNKLVIDVDTERERPIIIGKPEDVQKPTSPEEAQIMVKNDIICVTEALCTLINLAAHNGYGEKAVLINESAIRLHEMLIEPKPEEPLNETKNEE